MTLASDDAFNAIRVPLSKGYVAIVDPEFAWVLDHHWWAHEAPNGRVYACGRVPGPDGFKIQVKLHRLVLGEACRGLDVDHINGHGLDDRRANLRAVSRSINCRNVQGARKHNRSSGVLGVTWVERNQNWYARINVDGHTHNLGAFARIEDAVEARLRAERDLWGVEPRREDAHRAGVAS